METPEFVYLMTSRPKGPFYTGRTRDLVRRVWQHRNGIIKGHTARYRLTKLVYWEAHPGWESAWRRERRLKRYRRAWKINLVETKNPGWKDLWFQITGQDLNPSIPLDRVGPFDPNTVLRPIED
jgi:putative endonuclease